MSNTYENLFSGKKYTGLDKISKANDITFGLESDFIDYKPADLCSPSSPCVRVMNFLAFDT
jgi:lipopolysaccharide assembly outer membrane protein LptD (OstA)